MSIGTDFLGVGLASPSVLASGVLGVTPASLRRVHGLGAGLLTTKSVGLKRREGHHSPVVFDWGEGLINAVGLSNPGVDEFLARFGEAEKNFPLMVSIFGETADDFGKLALLLEELDFDFLELNLSCPNVLDEFGTPFSYSPTVTASIVKRVKESCTRPCIVKLSADAPDITGTARAAEEAGTDALCVMNTVGPGMIIDTHTAAPVLGNRTGGVSGRAVFPLTVRHVFELSAAVSIPVIGMGGVRDVDSALQVLMAGARLFGIGTGIYTEGIGIFGKINEGLHEFMERNGIKSLEEIIGIAHREKRSGCFSVPSIPDTGRDASFTVKPVADLEDSGPVRTLFFERDEMDKPEPGQFYMLWIPGLDQKPFSVSYADDRVIGFSIIDRGAFSSALFTVKTGDGIGLLGPLGRGFSTGLDDYLLVGGGIGSAPLLLSGLELERKGRKYRLLAGGKTTESLLWIEKLLKRAGSRIKPEYCTEDGSLGLKGLLTDHMDAVIQERKPGYILICGPERFIHRSLFLIERYGVEGEASIERMMKCGIGLCGSCSLDDSGDRVCVEGPVFGFAALRESREFGAYRRDAGGCLTDVD